MTDFNQKSFKWDFDPEDLYFLNQLGERCIHRTLILQFIVKTRRKASYIGNIATFKFVINLEIEIFNPIPENFSQNHKLLYAKSLQNFTDQDSEIYSKNLPQNEIFTILNYNDAIDLHVTNQPQFQNISSPCVILKFEHATFEKLLLNFEDQGYDFEKCEKLFYQAYNLTVDDSKLIRPNYSNNSKIFSLEDFTKNSFLFDKNRTEIDTVTLRELKTKSGI